MYVLYRGWADDYMDYALLDSHVRIEVRAWGVLDEVTEQYFVRPMSLRLVIDYLKKVGVRGVRAKIISRLKERGRNEKYVAVGFGIVSQMHANGSATARRAADAAGAEGTMLDVGSFVAFLATNHPRCVDRVVTHTRFVTPWSPVPSLDGKEVRFLPSLDVDLPETFELIKGWVPFSGRDVDDAAACAILTRCAKAFERSLASSLSGRRLAVEPHRPVREEAMPPPTSTAQEQARRGKREGVLFGLGQYAKVHILPNVRTHIDIRKVHEIDPLQIGSIGSSAVALDTYPFPRDDEHFDVYFVAGYHHLHAPIAVEALKRGRYAVVEKPLATTYDQLQNLAECLRDRRSRLFSCFHKRYSRFNSLLMEDLDARAGDPLHYHCVIHEMPLPKNHWYKWPHSAGRIVYNGCHWIDHFLYLNDFAAIRDMRAQGTAGGEIAVAIHLDNDASFTMTLSAFGSSRIGEREYVEVTTAAGFARITDGMHYAAENEHRVVRKARENPMALYAGMYRRISRRVADCKEGDAERTLASSFCALDLQDQVSPGA